ncbi:MAG: manganese efflux pump [Ruminococcus sp.]|nr:manganese efflux pump [Ruminococcus sp.]
MFFINTFFLGVSLSMDAFAVSVCKGLSMKKFSRANALIIGGFFGFFQAFMPLVGWAVGKQFARFVSSFSHWIAFALLAFIGLKMTIEAFRGNSSDEAQSDTLSYKELLLLAVATSIDALAVGVVFAFQGTKVLPSCAIIGIVTFVISAAGVFIGSRFGAKYNKSAQIAGGIILIALGIKLLLNGLGVF